MSTASGAHLYHCKTISDIRTVGILSVNEKIKRQQQHWNDQDRIEIWWKRKKKKNSKKHMYWELNTRIIPNDGYNSILDLCWSRSKQTTTTTTTNTQTKKWNEILNTDINNWIGILKDLIDAYVTGKDHPTATTSTKLWNIYTYVNVMHLPFVIADASKCSEYFSVVDLYWQRTEKRRRRRNINRTTPTTPTTRTTYNQRFQKQIP